MGTNFRSSRSTANALPGRCATPCWCRPAGGSWWRSTPTIRDFGRSTATCSTISKPGCSRRCAMSDLTSAPVLSLIGLALGLASAADAACLDLKQSLSLEGTLNRIFAGPPNYEDVRKGDTPEPTYILTLAEPMCASGDEFVDPRETFSQVQIF